MHACARSNNCAKPGSIGLPNDRPSRTHRQAARCIPPASSETSCRPPSLPVAIECLLPPTGSHGPQQQFVVGVASCIVGGDGGDALKESKGHVRAATA